MSVFDLWLPVLVTGFLTHVMSTLAWMVLPHHQAEWKALPGEDELLDLIGKHAVPPGQYMFPFAADPDEMKSEEYQEKSNRCRGMVVLWSSPVNMGLAIAKTLAFFFVAAFLIAYLSTLALAPGASFMKVFQFTSTAGLLTHCAGIFPGVFWFKREIAMDLLDKLAYAVITGLVFSVLWPA